MEARAGTTPHYILEYVCYIGLAEISFSISPISKYMSTLVCSVITQVEIKMQWVQYGATCMVHILSYCLIYGTIHTVCGVGLHYLS